MKTKNKLVCEIAVNDADYSVQKYEQYVEVFGRIGGSMISAELEDVLCCILASISIEYPEILEETNINSSLVLMYERRHYNVFTENDAVMIGYITPPEVGPSFGSWGIWDADADMIEDCGFSFCSREDRLRVVEAVKNISSEEEVTIDGFYDRNLTKINEMVKLFKL